MTDETTLVGDAHRDAWRIPTRDGSDYGVLVRCGPAERPYWWVLCPATATLHLESNGGVDDGCSIDPECDWGEVHQAAHALYLHLTAPDQEGGGDAG
jgi:hypothetical protein